MKNGVKFLGGLLVAVMGIVGINMSILPQNAQAKESENCEFYEVDMNDYYSMQDELSKELTQDELDMVSERMTNDAFVVLCSTIPTAVKETATEELGSAPRSTYIAYFYEMGYISRSMLGL